MMQSPHSPEHPPEGESGGEDANSTDPTQVSGSDDTVFAPRPMASGSDVMPDRIASYTVHGIIGRGGMGTVYRAEQSEPKRLVAVKVVNPGIASEEQLRRFKLESELLGRLRHPSIAQVYEAGTWDSGGGVAPFFAMEYIPRARTLTEYASSTNLSIDERLHLFMKVCAAVHHAHQKGVIHRDLKPENVLVTPEGVPKIIDFGVARAIDLEEAAVTMHTSIGAVIGTLQYMSPEQCGADPSEIDTRSDVYALGVMLYEMLSGELPYDIRGKALHEAIRVVQEIDPTAISSINRRLRGDVEVIANKAMEKEPPRRYQSASDLQQDIQRHLDGEPITAVPASAVYKMKKFVRRNRWGVAVATLLVALGVALMGVAWMGSLADARRQERNLMVQELVEFFMRDHFEEISQLAGSQEARELVVERSVSYLETLSESAESDPDLARVRAIGLLLTGNNAWSRRMGHAGEVEEAVGLWEEAMRIFDLNVIENHADMESRLGALECRLRLFDAYLRVIPGARSSAAVIITEAGVIARSLPQVSRDFAQGRLYLDYLLDAAAMASDDGDLADSRSYLQRAIDHATALQSRFPSELDLVRSEEVVRNRLAVLLLDEDEIDEAQVQFAAVLEIRLARLAQMPEGDTTRRDVLNSGKYVASCLKRGGDADAALSLIDELGLLLMARSLVEEQPRNDRARDDLGKLLQFRGELHRGIGAHSDGLLSFQEAGAIFQALSDGGSGQVDHSKRAVQAGAMEALSLVELEQMDAARQRMEEVVDLAADLVAASPDRSDLQGLHRWCVQVIGEMAAGP